MLCMTGLHVFCFCLVSINLWRFISGTLDSSLLDQCCDIGDTWYSQSRARCRPYLANIPNVTENDQDACRAVINICCLRERRSRQCQTGQLIATQRETSRRSCTSLYSQRQPYTSIICCNCCMLGLIAKHSTAGCHGIKRYSDMCQQSFMSCCHGDDYILTTASPEISTVDISTELLFLPNVTTPLTTPLTTPAPTPVPTTVPTTITTTAVVSSGLCRRFRGQLCAHRCTSTPTSYRCSCREGFRLMPDGRSCQKQAAVDPCNHPSMQCEHSCVMVDSAARCRCNLGYTLHVDRRSCSDINECQTGSHSCTPHQECVNSDGGYECVTIQDDQHTEVCEPGFVLNSITLLCDDINECLLRHHNCMRQEHCINTEGSFRCEDPNSRPTKPPSYTNTTQICRDGYEYDSLTNMCQDLDECSLGTFHCSGGVSACMNTIGAYRCRCESGFLYNDDVQNCEDVNECALGLSRCMVGQLCENTPGSYTCRRVLSCGTGYTLHTDSQQCVDNDECKLNTHNCGPAWECRNSLGSFRCVRRECLLGWTLNSDTGECDRVQCNRGLKADAAGNCIDINECVERIGACRATQQCHNTVGSYTCRNTLTCSPGYQLNEQGTVCEDVNECVRGTHSCADDLQTCVNRRGTYVCQCPDGYQIDLISQSCDDIDECTRYGGSVCSQNARCENSIGSFYCRCNAGFQSVDSNPRSTCQDVDECSVDGLCDHECRNSYGSYHCVCMNGFELATDTRTCHDLNECELWQDRPGGLCMGLCDNTPGSYSCSCPPGYRMSNDGRTCNDIDECMERTARCFGTEFLCVNTRGSYQCENIQCPSGFIRVPNANMRNRNIHCQRQTFTCQADDMVCLQQPISHTLNFITFPMNVHIPATLFTMRGHGSVYRRLEFQMELVSARDPVTGESRVNRNMFKLLEDPQRPSECQIVLLQRVQGPQDLVLKLKMFIYSREFQSTLVGATPRESFYGTAEAVIKMIITKDPWQTDI